MFNKFFINKYMHLKTNTIYTRYTPSTPIIDATNSKLGQAMILYEKDGKFFVREYNEFMEKFAPLLEGD